MKKSIKFAIFFLFCIPYTVQTHFNSWAMLHNNTALNFDFLVVGSYIKSENNSLETFNFSVTIPAHTCTCTSRLFFNINDQISDLKITGVKIDNHTLQMADYIYNTDEKNQYIVINYDKNNGFSLSISPITYYIYLLHNSKIMIQYGLQALMDYSEYLPY